MGRVGKVGSSHESLSLADPRLRMSLPQLLTLCSRVIRDEDFEETKSAWREGLEDLMSCLLALSNYCCTLHPNYGTINFSSLEIQ